MVINLTALTAILLLTEEVRVDFVVLFFSARIYPSALWFFTDLVLHYGDLTDSSNLNSILSKVQPDEIYNLAAQRYLRNPCRNLQKLQQLLVWRACIINGLLVQSRESVLRHARIHCRCGWSWNSASFGCYHEHWLDKESEILSGMII